MKKVISFIGKSNVGKSSLFNNVLNKEVSIVTHKQYTTNRCVEYMFNKYVMFIDTPGPIIKKFPLNFYNINKLIYTSINNANFIVCVIDINLTVDDFFILDLIRNTKKKKMLVISKIDKIFDKSLLLKFINNVSKYGYFESILPLSNKSIIDVEKFKSLVTSIISVSFSNNNTFSDSIYIRVLDIVRKILLNLLEKEIPYNINVKIENDSLNFDTRILHFLFLIKKISQKKIIIGECGFKIKNIIQCIKLEMRKIGFYIDVVKIKFKLDV